MMVPKPTIEQGLAIDNWLSCNPNGEAKVTVELSSGKAIVDHGDKKDGN
jgi:hypothetical protein